jgi:hypothetical protein
MITILVVVFFAAVIFMMMNNSNRNRRYNHRERFREKQEELLSLLRESRVKNRRLKSATQRMLNSNSTARNIIFIKLKLNNNGFYRTTNSLE